MSAYDNYKELVADKDLVIADQAESIKTWKLLYKIARDEARALRAQLKDIEEGRGNTTQPVFSDGSTECAECCASIAEDDFYCRACGKFIDWDDAIRDDDEPDTEWYAEEGERFLQAEVYEPPREAMRR